jgi:hypothetical protein
MAGRTGKFRRLKLVYCLIPLLFTHVVAAAAAEKAGVQFDDAYMDARISLPRRGVGILKYMMVIRVYTAAFYMDDGIPSEAVLSDVPKRLVIHYFRGIDADDFARSTDALILKNVGRALFERLRPRIDELNGMYEDVRPGDRYALTYIPGAGTTMALNGIIKGTFMGTDMARAIFSMWFGEKPLDASLKKALLGVP